MQPFRDNRSSMDNGLLLQMKGRKAVNIFRGCNYYLTIYLSAYCKICCFVIRKRLFYMVKPIVLRRKRAAFRM
ncbi:hypothetical protein HMPREF0662_02044 [Prevotella nigrescens F0103]|nr:hypothetical protein HMPREF0662_02044 [Prevotella nigrescens F0103]